MPWDDYHLHEFSILNPKTSLKDKIGLPVDDWDNDATILPGWKTKISSYFSLTNKKATYEYDFGDSWDHKITLEKVLPFESGLQYPRCLAGERACPPEDCGGVWGYESLLEIMNDTNHEEYEERMEWLGGEFDPEKFDPASVRFDDPKIRLKIMLSN